MIMEDFNGWANAAAVWKDMQPDTEHIGISIVLPSLAKRNAKIGVPDS